MKPVKTEQSLLATKKRGFEKMTQQIRWLVILIAAITFWGLPYESYPIILLIGLATLYNLARMTPLSRAPIVRSFITIITFDLVFAFFAIGVTGGIYSPFIIILALMAMSATYWYGPRGLIIVGAVEIIYVGGLVYFDNLIAEEWPLAIISLAFVLAVAYYVLRLTKDDREERAELRRLNTAVQREQQQLVSLVNSLSDGIIAVDTKGLISLSNKAAINLLGLEDTAGKPFDKAVEIYDGKGNRVSFFSDDSPEEEISRSDITKPLKNEVMSLEVHLTPFKIENEPQGTIVFVRDITKQKSLDEERDEFISLASHELRTPLALMEGNLSMVISAVGKSGRVNHKHVDALKNTYRNVRHLSAIVADLTTLDQADKGLLEVELERIDIGEVVKNLVVDYSKQAADKGVKMTYEIDKDTKPVVTSKFRLVEILTNFIANAIKYTSKDGSIVVRAAPDSHSGGVLISVSDTGVGISSADKQRIFDKFYRSEKYHTRETEGTGLGLYIVKKLTARLNGEVSLDSELGKGSTFYLRVPQYSKFREDQPKVIAADVDSFIKGV